MNLAQFYEKDIDNPHTVNGFKGTWQFSDHQLIPDVLHDFIQRYFGVYRIRRIPLEDINSVMNEVWEGPGSLEKVFRMAQEMRGTRDVEFTRADIAAIKAKRAEDEEDNEGLVLPNLPVNSFADFDESDND